MRPALPEGYRVAVVGGDAFLELHVPHGHTALVPDYDQGPGTTTPPYLRFRADGTVERNERANATAANASRYGTSSTTPDASAPPRWKVVDHGGAGGGTYVWHDHRIHWMGPVHPKAVDRNGRVDLGGPGGTWSVPIVVDGHRTEVRGELLLYPSPSPVGWYLVVAAVALAGAGLAAAASRARRPVPYRAVAGAIAVLAALPAAIAGWAAWRSIPAAAGGNVLPFAVPVVAMVAALVASLGPARARLVTLGATAACLVGWSVLRLGVLTHAVLPTDLPFTIDRAATALALGAGLGLAVALVWRPPPRTARAAAAPPS